MQKYNPGLSPREDRKSANDDDLDNWDEELIIAVGQKVGKSEKDPEGVRLCRMKLCLDEGARINTQDRNGDTALHIAVRKDYQQIIKLLLQAKARTDIHNHKGLTAITLAETLRKEDITIILENSVASDFLSAADNQEPSTSRDRDIMVQQKPTFEDEGKIEEISGLKEAKTYPAAATLTRSWPGIVYQLKHLEFTLHCALQKDSVFFLATEMIAAGKLDDVVLQYTNDEGMQVGRFVQIKHRNNEYNKISANHLLQDDGDFSVPNYFMSWRNVKDNELFSRIQVRNMILCTNINLDLDNLTKNKIYCEPAAEPDETFEVNSNVKETAWYKVSADKRFNETLYGKLKTCEVRRLAKLLAECVYNSKPIRLEMDCFQDYHLALVKHVFDAKIKKFHQRFIDNENLSPRVEKFRQIFLSEYQRIAKISKNHSSEQLLWNDIEKRFEKVEIRKNFGKVPRLVPNPQLTNLNDFTLHFVELLNKPVNDCVVEIVTKKSKTDGARELIKVIVDNIDKLAGHVLVRVGNKIKFSSQFLKDNHQLAGNINEFRKVLKNRVGNEHKLKRFEFVIKNYETWSEHELLAGDELPDDIDDDEISNFLKEFTLAVNQPDVRELGEIISRKIGENALFNRLRVDQIGSTFRLKILEWFSDQGKKGNDVEYLSYEVCKKFLDDMKDNISSFVTSGISTLYCEKMKAYEIYFKSGIQEVEKFLNMDGSDSSSRRIMQLRSNSEDTFSYGLRVYNTLQKIPKYTQANSFIFIRIDDLILPEIMNQVKRSFESPDHPDLLLVDFGSYSGAQEYKLWNLLTNIIEKTTNKKMIIITGVGNDLAIPFEIDPELRIKETDESSFSNLTDDSRKKLLGKQVTKFQGQKIRISFGKLLGIYDSNNLSADELKDLAEIIDSDMLVELIRNDEIHIGGNLEGLGEIQDYYINRTFLRRVMIKGDILEDPNIHDLFAISGVGREPSDMFKPVGQTSQIERNLTNCTILDCEQEEKQFKALCAENVDLNIHWLIKESGEYIWKQSKGVIANLLQHRYATDNESDDGNDGAGATFLNEDELAAHFKPIIISDTAGMGKSTVLTYLAQEIKEKEPDTLVLKINLNHHAIALADVMKNSTYNLRVIEQAIQFLVKELLSHESSSARNVFKRIIRRQGKVALLFDGFDEISPTYEDTVINFLETLANYGIKKLAVTTRPHTRETLERKLNVFSYEIQPLSGDSQEYFLIKFWKTRLASCCDSTQMTEIRIRKYSKALMKKLADSIQDYRNKLTGNPLQAKLVAEIFASRNVGKREDFNSCEEFINSEADQPIIPEKIDLNHLYQQFVEQKFNTFFIKRGGNLADVAVIEDRKLRYDTFLQTHGKLALFALFDKDKAKRLLPSLENKPDITKERTGIITQFIDGQPHFGHRTYAEYFGAMFLSDMLKECEPNRSVQKIFVADILLKNDYKNIRAFLNSFFSSQQNNALAGKSWEPHLNKYRNILDETIFHVAAKEGNGHIIKMFLKRNREALVYKKNCYNRTAVQLAVEYGHLDELKLLIEWTKYRVYSEIVENGMMSLLHFAAMGGKLDIAQYLLDKGQCINATASEGFTPLHLAVGDMNSDTIMTHALINWTSKMKEAMMIDLRRRSFSKNLELVKYLIDKGANVNLQSNNGLTALHRAAATKELEIVKHLVDMGANINSRNRDGVTPLHLAAQEGQVDIVKYLLNKEADANCQMNDGQTPLELATSQGKLEVVKYLIENGANVNCQRKNGSTPLHAASMTGKLDLVKHLIDKGANVNSKEHIMGATSLHVAAQEGHLDIVKYLLDQGVDPDCPYKNGLTLLEIAATKGKLNVVKYLIEKVFNVDSKQQLSVKPLRMAIQEGQLNIVNYLLDQGINVNSVMNNGRTPLEIASANGKLEIVKFLIEKGANINLLSYNSSTMPLHMAAQEGQLEIVKYLLDQGANINCPLENGETPLELAALNGKLDVVKYLVGKGAIVNSKYKIGVTPLHMAAQEDQLDIVKHLLDKGAEVNCSSNNGATPLILAALNGKLNVVKYLTENGANVNSISDEDYTPLHAAAQEGRLEVVQYLLDMGVDINFTSLKLMVTPLYVAFLNGKSEIVKYLLERGANKLSSQQLVAIKSSRHRKC